jgi:uncharacterized coiled-coil protein SlyX
MIVQFDLDQAAQELTQAIAYHQAELGKLRAQLDLIAHLRTQAEAQARETLPEAPSAPGALGELATPDTPASE